MGGGRFSPIIKCFSFNCPHLMFLGRNETKLRSVLKSAGEKLGDDISDTPVSNIQPPSNISFQVLTCDSSSPESLLAMARQARVVLNCVGPYRYLMDRCKAHS